LHTAYVWQVKRGNTKVMLDKAMACRRPSVAESSSVPTSAGDTNVGMELTNTDQHQPDGTHQKALMTSQVSVRVYGYFERKSPYYLSYDKVIFVAAGTGLSALLPHLKNYIEHSAVPISERKIHLIWCVRNRVDVRAYAPLLIPDSKHKRASGETVIDMSEVKIDIYITGDAKSLDLHGRTGEGCGGASSESGCALISEHKDIEDDHPLRDLIDEGEDDDDDDVNTIGSGIFFRKSSSLGAKPFSELIVAFLRVYKKVVLAAIAAGSLIGGLFLARVSHPGWSNPLSICQDSGAYKAGAHVWFSCFIW
jgi:hypothetical protein